MFCNQNQEKETVMEQEIYITIRFNLATGKGGLDEIIYKLKELRGPLILKILEQILRGYDNFISKRLSRTDICPSVMSRVKYRFDHLCFDLFQSTNADCTPNSLQMTRH